MPDDKLTQEYQARFGTLSVHRGRDSDKKPLFSWEPIPDCTDQMCPLTDKCDYVQREGKCRVVGGIVRSAAVNILTNYGLKINNAVRNRIGTQLMPLYVQLAKLYTYEASLSSVHFVDNKGNPKINPVYKDIRDTLRSIDLQWKNLGLSGMPVEGGMPEPGDHFEEMESHDLGKLNEREKKKQTFKVVKKAAK